MSGIELSKAEAVVLGIHERPDSMEIAQRREAIKEKLARWMEQLEGKETIVAGIDDLLRYHRTFVRLREIAGEAPLYYQDDARTNGVWSYGTDGKP